MIDKQELQSAQILQDIGKMEQEIEREQIKLSQEMKEILKNGLEKIQNKTSLKEPIYEEDMEFVKEIREWMEKEKLIRALVESQYQGSLEILKKSGLYDPNNLQTGDRRHPEKNEVRELLSKTLKPEQLETIKQMQKPVFQLVPIRPMEEYKKALNLHKPIKNQQDAYINDWTKDAFERANLRDKAEQGKITSFRVVITEGADAPDLLHGDNEDKTLEERIAWFKKNYESKGIRGSDYKSYMLLQIAGLLGTPPRPVDDDLGDKTWTMLNMEEIFENRVASGNCRVNFCQLYLVSDRTADQNNRARFRASVTFDVPS